MDRAIAVTVVAAGLFFSLACAVLIEEFVVGALFRFFFRPRMAEATANEPVSVRK
jgi:hypothetical protein